MRAAILLALAPLLLAGCSTDAPPQTAEQVKDFKGGPMPAEFREKFMKQQANQGPAAGAKPGG